MNGLQKFYLGLWIALAIVTLALFITGTMTMVVITVLGTVVFGLVFMGMMCVLPTMVTDQVTDQPHEDEAKPIKVKAESQARSAGRFRRWFQPIAAKPHQRHAR